MNRLSNQEKKQLKALVKRGYSLNSISNKTGLSKSTIYYNISKLTKKMSKINIQKLSEWEKGYITGLFFGDGNLYLGKRSQYRVVFNFSKLETNIVNNLIKLIEKAESKATVTNPKEMKRITCTSKQLYSFMKIQSLYVRKRKGDKWIMKKIDILNFSKWNKDYKFGFVGGLIDSDGCITKDKGKYLRVFISTRSKDFVKSFSTILTSLHIIHSIQFSKTRDENIIRLSTPSYLKFKSDISAIKGR